MIFKRKSKLRLLTVLIGIALTLSVVVISVWDPPLVGILRVKYFDTLNRINPADIGSTPVIIVDIDSESLAAFGQWPWPRNLMADLLDRILEGKPAVVGFDILFAEPDRSSPSTLIENGIDQADIPASLEEFLKSLPNHDLSLAKVLYFSKIPVILGHTFTNDEMGENTKNPKSPGFAMMGDDPSSSLFHFTGVDANLNMFEKTAAGSGFFNIIPDDDGIVRREALLISKDDQLFPSLVLSMLQAVSGTDPIIVTSDLNGVREVRVGPHHIPTDSAGQIIINYSGPARTFTYISAQDLLLGNVEPGTLSNAFVLIGTSAPGLFDIRATPTDRVFPGIEIHANTLNTIFNQDYLERPEWALGAEVVYVLACGLLLTFLLPKLTAIWGIVLVLLLAGSMTSLSLWNYYQHQLLVDLVYPLLATGMLFTVLTVLNFKAEEKKARYIRSSFSRYIEPALVERLVVDQESLDLGGEERELSILFSDIRGFTTLSETMSPQDLCTFLNEYLTPMTDAVMEHQGTVDKFIGDAVMAFWNAPLKTDHHSLLACTTALQMIEALDALNESWGKKGLPSIQIGIGVHRGVARVGNMGSQQRFDYTIMGDAVNLCSRLEGLTKMYGADILVSSTVYEKVSDSGLMFRMVDTVRVKGKSEPVVVYELIGRGEPDQELVAKLELHDKAMSAYAEGSFEEGAELFSSLREGFPEDKLYALYEGRCLKLKEAPPPEWDGITDMTTK